MKKITYKNSTALSVLLLTICTGFSTTSIAQNSTDGGNVAGQATQLLPQLGNSEATQTMEYKTENNCPEGTTGNNEYARKVYTRTDNSRFEEPWYLTKTNCVKTVEGNLTPGQYSEVTNYVNNNSANVVNYLNNMGLTSQQRAHVLSLAPAAGGKGSFATRIFNLPYNINNSVAKSVCVVGIDSYGQTGVDYLGRPTYIGPPTPKYYVSGPVSNPVIGTMWTGKPYADWVSTGNQNGSPIGPVCPAGSYLHILDAQQTAPPEAP